MSLQDDIFDVKNALKRKPIDKAAFENIIRHLCNLEDRCERLSEENYVLKRAIKIIKENE
jgi:hypothetical protein